MSDPITAGMILKDGSALVKLLSLVPAAGEAIKKFYGKPSKEDLGVLREFVRYLDERRMFSAPFAVEVVELVLGSIRAVLSKTSDTQAKLNHPFSQQAVGLILDACRAMMDKWHRFRTPRFRDQRPPADEEMAKLVNFCEDLGELRARVREALLLLREFSDPALKAPSSLGE